VALLSAGVGLSVSKEIICLHGGVIGCTSHQAVPNSGGVSGSEFYFSLPCPVNPNGSKAPIRQAIAVPNENEVMPRVPLSKSAAGAVVQGHLHSSDSVVVAGGSKRAGAEEAAECHDCRW
jgi:hypothetical protein